MDVRKAVWILDRLNGFGIQKFKRLRDELGDLAKLFDPQILSRLHASPEWGLEFAAGFREILASGDFEREIDRCAKTGIQMLSLLDREYPKNLSSVYDPPLILYVKGALIPEDEVAVAVVGSRHPTAYGLRTASRLAAELAERGVTVVSGFARGIDGEAHRGALRAKGRTIAVLGCGVDVIYPKEHASLYESVSSNGAIVSEFPFGTPPQAFNFPRRNRVISGLTMGVLVVEASKRSGSLITASIAAEEGREVYAVPGPIDSVTSGGTNQLIQKGAKAITSVADILEDLTPQIRASLSSWQARRDGGGPMSVIARSEGRACDLTLSSQGDEAPGAISGSGIASTSPGTPFHNDAQCGSPASSGSLPRPLTGSRRSNDDFQDPVLKLLTNQPLSFDEIALGLAEDPIQIRSHLTQLELQGVVRRVFGGRYVRSK